MSQVNNTQGQGTQQPKSFDPRVVKRAYGPTQWGLKEDYYIKEVQSITVPQGPNPADIANVANRIEAVLSLARLDMAFVQQNYESYERALKIEERRLFVDLKINPPTGYQNIKLTVDDMKGIVAVVIKKTPWNVLMNPNAPVSPNAKSLYDIVIESEKRYIFMNNIIQALCDKKDLLITHNSVIKAEASLNGMSNSGGNNNRNRQED